MQTSLARRLAAGRTVDPEVAFVWDQIVTRRGRVRVEPLAAALGGSRKRLCPGSGISSGSRPNGPPQLRVHRPKSAHRRLPPVVSFHGGGFIAGTAAQNDWLNSHVAAHCPAVVVSVEYRLATSGGRHHCPPAQLPDRDPHLPHDPDPGAGRAAGAPRDPRLST